MKVTKDDFDKAKEKVLYLKKGDIPEGLYIWCNQKINILKNYYQFCFFLLISFFLEDFL
jgi:hypothetical protein